MALSDDLTTIEQVLKRSRRNAHTYMRGGLLSLYQDTTAALESLDRVRAILQPPIPIVTGGTHDPRRKIRKHRK